MHTPLASIVAVSLTVTWMSVCRSMTSLCSINDELLSGNPLKRLRTTGHVRYIWFYGLNHNCPLSCFFILCDSQVASFLKLLNIAKHMCVFHTNNLDINMQLHAFCNVLYASYDGICKFSWNNKTYWLVCCVQFTICFFDLLSFIYRV